MEKAVQTVNDEKQQNMNDERADNGQQKTGGRFLREFDLKRVDDRARHNDIDKQYRKRFAVRRFEQTEMHEQVSA